MPDRILKLLFPPKCIFCSKILRVESDIDICKECFNEIPFLNNNGTNRERNIFLNRYCDKVVCVSEYTSIIKEALIKFKFRNKPSLYRALGKLLFYKIAETMSLDKIDMVISIPLSRKRYMERGYNQAGLIAKVISRELNVPDCSAVLKRARETQSQRLLARRERYQNVKDAFVLVDPYIVEGKTIILVDDIYTTGSTIGECAKVLMESGAQSVVAGVIASGRKY